MCDSQDAGEIICARELRARVREPGGCHRTDCSSDLRARGRTRCERSLTAYVPCVVKGPVPTTAISRARFFGRTTASRIKMGCFGSKDKLSKEDMDFLKSHTRYDEATIKEWYKGFKQDCPNGRLTPAKFVDMYKMFFPSGNAEEFCDHVFRTFDMDKNGYIDFKEFLLAIDVTSSGTPEEKLKWAFRMYDVDGNGVIDMQEMTKIVQAIYDMLGACSSNRPADSAEERAKNIFAKMDENNDGQLTQEEFLKGCLQDEELSKMLAP
ncbi:neuronal calcium sensor 2 isoform X1 [Cataglyphis hispanica]|uniref:neuronal calcium sensor 2 isoform X1 n=1 Tax=Cataglyphis hispanica TaxID=1086592 RepID=UPI00217F5673|nr:neuronal calcium sensor 2 isoform X1 [Cataglyphis hispanica]